VNMSLNFKSIKSFAWNWKSRTGTYYCSDTNAVTDQKVLGYTNDYKSKIAKRFINIPWTDLQNKKINLGNEIFTSVKRDGEFTMFVFREGQPSYFVNPNGRARWGLPVNLELEELLRSKQVKALCVVGELWFFDNTGKRTFVHDFLRASRTPESDADITHLVFDVFDIVELDNTPMLDKNFKERFDSLKRIFPMSELIHKESDPLGNLIHTKIVDTSALWPIYQSWVGNKTAEADDEAEIDAKVGGQEGMVLRTGISGKNFKVKPFYSIDAVIIGYLPNLEDDTILSTLLVALIRDDGNYQVLGKVGGGFTDLDRVKVREILKKEEIDEGDVIVVSGDGRKYKMVDPKHIIKIYYQELIQEESDGSQPKKLILKKEDGRWKRLSYVPFVSMRSARYVKQGDDLFREDKGIPSDVSVGMNQITRLFPVEVASSIEQMAALPKSEILFTLVKGTNDKRLPKSIAKAKVSEFSEKAMREILNDLHDNQNNYGDPAKLKGWIDGFMKAKTFGDRDHIPGMKFQVVKLYLIATNKTKADKNYPTYVVVFVDYAYSNDLVSYAKSRDESYSQKAFPFNDIVSAVDFLIISIIDPKRMGRKEWDVVRFKHTLKNMVLQSKHKIQGQDVSLQDILATTSIVQGEPTKQASIIIANLLPPENEYARLRGIFDQGDAYIWISQYANVEDIDQYATVEDIDQSDRLIDDALKELHLEKIDDLIGYWDEEYEKWDIPENVFIPESPFDAAGKLLPGWEKKKINVISIIDGRLYDESVEAYVNGNYALVKRDEYEAAVI